MTQIVYAIWTSFTIPGKNYFFWRNSQSEELIYHFEMFIKPHLS